MVHTIIHGHSVSYDDSKHHDRIHHAAHYLEYGLSAEESEVFFKDAKSKEGSGESTHFEDDAHTNCRIIRHDGEYLISIRE